MKEMLFSACRMAVARHADTPLPAASRNIRADESVSCCDTGSRFRSAGQGRDNRPEQDVQGYRMGPWFAGIAVFRYEKRTRRYPSKFAAHNTEFTVKQETIDDVVEAVAF